MHPARKVDQISVIGQMAEQVLIEYSCGLRRIRQQVDQQFAATGEVVKLFVTKVAFNARNIFEAAAPAAYLEMHTDQFFCHTTAQYPCAQNTDGEITVLMRCEWTPLFLLLEQLIFIHAAEITQHH